MQLRSVHLVNYRCFRDLRVDFQPGFNVLTGVNGSGKTSLLRGVCDALTMFAASASISAEGEDYRRHVRLQWVELAGRLRFEPQYPMQVRAVVNAFDREFLPWMNVKEGNGPEGTWMGGDTTDVLRWKHADDPPSLPGLEQRCTALPILAFYRAQRHWKKAQPTELKAATQRHSRFDAYQKWRDASLDVESLLNWVISKCLERLEALAEDGSRYDSIDDELAMVNAAVAAAVPEASGLSYNLKQKTLLVEWNGAVNSRRTSSPFEHLSDGQQAMIGLFADIARRMCLLNPQLGDRVLAETPGVVLIDELDVHLHPRWQRDIVTGLQRAFPKVQFIVASHSPVVLGELQPEQIILLRPEGTDHPPASYGLDSSQVLEEIMGAAPRAAEVEQALSEVFALLERMQLDSARSKLDELRRLAPGIPELAGAEALLKRKEVLGR